MRVIWKFEYMNSGVCDGVTWRLTLPKDWILRHVEGRNKTLWIWIELDDQGEREEVEFELVGTGWPIPAKSKYLGTGVQGDGLVWHLHQLSVQSQPLLEQPSAS